MPFLFNLRHQFFLHHLLRCLLLTTINLSSLHSDTIPTEARILEDITIIVQIVALVVEIRVIILGAINRIIETHDFLALKYPVIYVAQQAMKL